jgi:hypothetical protein
MAISLQITGKTNFKKYGFTSVFVYFVLCKKLLLGKVIPVTGREGP